MPECESKMESKMESKRECNIDSKRECKMDSNRECKSYISHKVLTFNLPFFVQAPAALATTKLSTPVKEEPTLLTPTPVKDEPTPVLSPVLRQRAQSAYSSSAAATDTENRLQHSAPVPASTGTQPVSDGEEGDKSKKKVSEFCFSKRFFGTLPTVTLFLTSILSYRAATFTNTHTLDVFEIDVTFDVGQTREERKMEAILKAIARLEKQEERKNKKKNKEKDDSKNETTPGSESSPTTSSGVAPVAETKVSYLPLVIFLV